MNKKTLVKEIIKNNKKYLILHWILITLIGIDIISKLLIGFSLWEGSVFFIIILLIIILLFSGVALIGLMLYKVWGYWIVILLIFNTLNSDSFSIYTIVIYLPIPIYLIYKISQEKKRILSEEKKLSQTDN